jgi:subtilisin family serine protease
VRFRFLAVAVVALAFTGTAAARVDADPLAGQQWWFSHVGADRATPPGPGIPITIVDTGADTTHAEFAGRPNTTYLNAQSVFGKDEFHGTAVASVAGAPENGVGIQGLYPLAALQLYDASPDATGITEEQAVTGVTVAAQHCPAVISLSFGSTEQDANMHNAILTALRNGCFVVAAAGNNGLQGSPPAYPATWPHVFTVGETDHNDNVAPMSSVGPALDVVAPGIDILAAVPLTRNSTGYQLQAGTSFAAPIVAAAAAWVWTVRPTLTVAQLTEVLRRSARDIGQPGFDNASGYGMLDIPAALAAPTPADDPVEPNDDIDQIKPGLLFSIGTPALTTGNQPSARITASLEAADDPRDLYRIWVPAKKFVRVSVASGGTAAARLWGPKTVSVNEGVRPRRRDLRGQRMYGGKHGSAAYVEVLLTGRSMTSSYVLTVTAAKR